MRRGFVCTAAAWLAGSGLALAQVPAPSEGPAPPSTPVMGGGATPYSPLTPSSPVPVPFGLSAGGPGELMTCPGSACGGDCGNVFNQMPYTGTKRFWINGDYLLWRTKTADLPSLTFNQPLGTVTVQQITQVAGGGSNGVTNQVINQQLPVLLAATSSTPGLSWQDQPGLRFMGGFWFDDDQKLGIDAGFLMLWRRTEQFANAPNPSPTGAPYQLLIPTGFVDTFLAAGISSASATVPVNLLASVGANSIGNFSSELWGTEFNLRSRKCWFGCTTIDFIAGVRYLNLDESINNSEVLQLTGITTASNPSGTSPTTSPVSFNGSIHDSISCQNNFYGGQVGAYYDWMIGHGLFLAGWTKLAIGDNHEDIALHGFTSAINAAGAVQNFPGGNLVGPADNNTLRTFDRISAVPELAMNLGYQPYAWLRFYGGYTFLMMSSVARPGDQTTFVPTTANVTIGGTTASTGAINAPTFQVHNTSFWAQGVNFGIEIRY